ncbi:MAG TPA: hypothetical protein LFW21_07610 [Rickettsia endosymbiont of Pyrocoelia pectoralis]|nr:hypothetical protein [Rickettsia endosymbiont of Pyrocoelia pectoralis]
MYARKKSSNNYALFNKYLSKILKTTINKFGSLDNIIIFLLELCECGYIGLAAKNLKTAPPFISPLLVYKIIRNDIYLAKCVKLAQNYAAEMAEAVLYDRAINGYEEITLNAQGECITRKKKYCSKSLLEYLKANSAKYQIIGKNNYNDKDDKKINTELVKQLNETAIFEVEAYESSNSTEKPCD